MPTDNCKQGAHDSVYHLNPTGIARQMLIDHGASQILAGEFQHTHRADRSTRTPMSLQPLDDIRLPLQYAPWPLIAVYSLGQRAFSASEPARRPAPGIGPLSSGLHVTLGTYRSHSEAQSEQLIHLGDVAHSKHSRLFHRQGDQDATLCLRCPSCSTQNGMKWVLTIGSRMLS